MSTHPGPLDSAPDPVAAAWTDHLLHDHHVPTHVLSTAVVYHQQASTDLHARFYPTCTHTI